VNCHWLCNHPYFGNVVLLCIMVSSAMLAAEDPLDSNSERNKVPLDSNSERNKVPLDSNSERNKVPLDSNSERNKVPLDSNSEQNKVPLDSCSATAPVSYPASLRNSPNGCQGHPRSYPPPPDRPPDTKPGFKQCSDALQFLFNYWHGLTKNA
jgi:hypothetical protein